MPIGIVLMALMTPLSPTLVDVGLSCLRYYKASEMEPLVYLGIRAVEVHF